MSEGKTDGLLAKRSSSATKNSTPIIETLQAISVITRDQRDDQTPQTVGNELRCASGVLSDANAEQRAEDYMVFEAVPNGERRILSR